MRMIFVNLPVKDISRSKAFFGGLGFTFNPDFSSDDTLCMIVEENIFVMLMQEARIKEFIIDEISDTSKVTEVLTRAKQTRDGRVFEYCIGSYPSHG